ncbi:MAG: AbrB/MazE/SpoVT family DNA-binding domain-containing protein [Longimicrobiales bacterium]
MRFESVPVISYSFSMKSRVTDRGQVTIPKELRDRLGIRPGQIVEFSEDRGTIVLRRRMATHPVDELYGILEDASSSDELLAILRGQAADEL